LNEKFLIVQSEVAAVCIRYGMGVEKGQRGEMWAERREHA